ncbi:MAG: inositol monophosphatase family protein [Deltaproteobacteria bacterium]
MVGWDENELLRVAAEVAREAGALIRSRVPQVRQIATKANAVDLVTDTDRAADALISARLGQAFPQHARLTEESDIVQGAAAADICWVVDPLDGTVNFAHGVPQFAVSIAAVTGFVPGGSLRAEPQARALAGVVYDPMRDELFSATASGAAQCNGEPIGVAPCERLHDGLIATGFPYDRRERADEYLADWHRILPLCRDLRRCGAAALDLAWVAMGRVDGYWERGLQAWDIAAGALIARRAGALATNFSGTDLFLDASEILVASPLVYAELRTLLQPENEAK